MREPSSTAEAAVPVSIGVPSDYLELTKPSVVWLIILSTAVGFYMGSPGSLSFALFSSRAPRSR